MQISPRQSVLLRTVVEGHVELGQPVGSRWLAERTGGEWGPSTIRAELARLEELGLLAHPHTSAGRVPTDRGYRQYVDHLLEHGELPAVRPKKVEAEIVRRELDDAMRATTEQLSQVTNLLAIVSAPPIGTTTIKHVEVLLLQPQVAMVVVITSTGGVTKRVIAYDEPVDGGLVKWAGEYLNDQLVGMGLGARMLHGKLTARDLGTSEREFLTTLAPAFTELEATAEDTLYVDGTARLLSEERLQDLSQINEIMLALERRVTLLAMLRQAVDESSVYLRIGHENELPELQSLSVVAAHYGLPGRSLGAVSVLGPVRMDYPGAIVAVREAAAELSRVVGVVYEGVKRDVYEVLGVPRDADERQIKKAFRAKARELHPDVNRHDPDAEEKFKELAEAHEIASDPDRRSVYDRYGHEGLNQRGFESPFQGFGSFSDIFDAFFGGSEGGGGAGGATQGGDVAVAVEISLGEAAADSHVDVEYDAVDLCEHCRGNAAEPGTPIRTCERCGGAGQLRAVTRTAFGQLVRTQACDVCHGDGKIPETPCTVCNGRGRQAAHRKLSVDIPAGIADEQRIRLTGRGHAGERGGPPGDLYVLVRVAEDERFVRDGNDLVHVLNVPAPGAALGSTVTVPTLDGDEEVEIPAGTQPGAIINLRGRGMPSLRRGRRGDQRVLVNVVIPRNLNGDQRELLARFQATRGPHNLADDGDRDSLFSRVRRAFG